MQNAFYLGLGVLLLTFGGEALIRGALATSKRLGVSPLLSGLVIVGFGTSAPELVVSIDAALSSSPDIAVGNVVGSNIGNILLILGLCAIITPLAAKPLVLWRDAVIMVAATALFLVLIIDQHVSTTDAAIFILSLAGYLVWAYRTERTQHLPSGDLHQAESEAVTTLPSNTLGIAGAIVLGLVLMIGGSQLLLTGAIGIATYFQVSEALIGLTLVAVGTSLPELSISLIAAIRKQADVAVGNVLGSNIFNILGILGISALLQPLPVHERIMQFDQWVVFGTALLLLLFLFTKRILSRSEGAVLLLAYLLYLYLSLTFFGS
ncbi:MAG: sodium:calcium antiporter [Oleiphilus sp.]|nr:MAG: sodium:calcium antiporter [Oleiphilus sp.]